MKTRLVRIGNSRGVRLAKPLIEEAGLTDEVDIRVRGGALVITPLSTLRDGWADAATRIASSAAGALLDGPTPTKFDDEEWKW